MRQLCSCGHPNLLHFAGTGHCHAEDLSDIFVVLPWMQVPRCDCSEFVLDESALEPVRERKDTA